jgi:hypothetical protein
MKGPVAAAVGTIAKSIGPIEWEYRFPTVQFGMLKLPMFWPHAQPFLWGVQTAVAEAPRFATRPFLERQKAPPSDDRIVTRPV